MSKTPVESTPKIIKDSLVRPGQKFIVKDFPRESSYGPGTLGYACYISQNYGDYRNVVVLNTWVTRKGKTGKERLDSINLYIPLFMTEAMEKHDKYPGYFPMGDRYYVHIEPVQDEGSILTVSPVDFIAWVGAMISYFHNALFGQSDQPIIMPEDKSDPINLAWGLIDRYQNDIASTVEKVQDEEYRKRMVRAIRRLEAQLTRCAAAYHYNVLHKIVEGATWLRRLSEQDSRLAPDLKVWKDTEAFYYGLLPTMKPGGPKPEKKAKKAKGYL